MFSSLILMWFVTLQKELDFIDRLQVLTGVVPFSLLVSRIFYMSFLSVTFLSVPISQKIQTWMI